VAVWLSCAVDPQPETMQQLLRAIVGYLAAPGYAEIISEAGFAEWLATTGGKARTAA
jgi:predicted ATP-grasp superfamily ATP-dependent carboligase